MANDSPINATVREADLDAQRGFDHDPQKQQAGRRRSLDLGPLVEQSDGDAERQDHPHRAQHAGDSGQRHEHEDAAYADQREEESQKRRDREDQLTAHTG
jgi:hypothetical protein